VLLLAFFRSDAGSLAALAQKMAAILENSRQSLPDWLIGALPDSVDGTKTATVAVAARTCGAGPDDSARKPESAIAHVLIGLIVGAMLALREVGDACG
jgi:hypothetical protein